MVEVKLEILQERDRMSHERKLKKEQRLKENHKGSTRPFELFHTDHR